MLIRQPPMVTEPEFHVCEYHKRNPGKPYAGCTCSGIIKGKVKPIEDWTDAERAHYYGVEALDGN